MNRKNFTMLPKGRARWLVDMIQARGFEYGAEIGAGTGVTTSHIILNCRKLKEYIVVDDWRPVAGGGSFDRTDMKEIFESQIKNNKKVKVLEGISWEMADKVKDKYLDFVFIDASHDYDSVLKDLKAWIPKVRPGGIISGHDVNWLGVKQALQEVLPGYELAGVNNVWYNFVKL